MCPRPATREIEAQGVAEVAGPDLDALLHFYLATGFELERRQGDFAVVHWHDTRVSPAQTGHAAVRECFSSLRILVPDVDALWKPANRLALKIGNPIADHCPGLRDFTLVDPAGLGLGFAQVLAE